MAKKITKAEVLEALYDLLGEASPWEHDDPADAQKLAFYNEGARDMASTVLRLIEE